MILKPLTVPLLILSIDINFQRLDTYRFFLVLKPALKFMHSSKEHSQLHEIYREGPLYDSHLIDLEHKFNQHSDPRHY